MARSNSGKPELSALESSVISDPEEPNPQDTEVPEEVAESVEDAQDVDSILNSLKTLLSTVEKLQKVRQEVGDIKPLLVRMLDGELVAGEDLEQLKTGVGGLFRLVRAHSDHQAALAKAQPARSLLDEVLKVSSTRSEVTS
ncbi:MAG: hypothetical protein H7126_15650 [Candidatus Parcubacteria bacterium]|uniref:hypothetical protein n=1 Tax=Phormidesmis priestleyi TaxID=268141 RepID=UPI00083B9400|nr:hypothetical protein [Phormidesmis priestleyi]MBC7825267.1 hypothetical protein [Leptolyngbyaceae cyanobacterium LF-bin-113]